jgi:hypothetical protein
MREFICRMRRYLIMDEDTSPGGVQTTDCGDMFTKIFSIIAARPDYTQDRPSYRGYMIKFYTSWVGRPDDSHGLIFNEHLFHKYKMSNLVPVLLEQLQQPASGNGALVHLWNCRHAWQRSWLSGWIHSIHQPGRLSGVVFESPVLSGLFPFFGRTETETGLFNLEN